MTHSVFAYAYPVQMCTCKGYGQSELSDVSQWRPHFFALLFIVYECGSEHCHVSGQSKTSNYMIYHSANDSMLVAIFYRRHIVTETVTTPAAGDQTVFCNTQGSTAKLNTEYKTDCSSLYQPSRTVGHLVLLLCLSLDSVCNCDSMYAMVHI